MPTMSEEKIKTNKCLQLALEIKKRADGSQDVAVVIEHVTATRRCD